MIYKQLRGEHLLACFLSSFPPQPSTSFHHRVHVYLLCTIRHAYGCVGVGNALSSTKTSVTYRLPVIFSHPILHQFVVQKYMYLKIQKFIIRFCTKIFFTSHVHTCIVLYIFKKYNENCFYCIVTYMYKNSK